jgi:hypothetical protein
MKLNLAAVPGKLAFFRSRLECATFPVFHHVVVQFWNFCQSVPTIQDIFEPLKNHSSAAQWATAFSKDQNPNRGLGLGWKTELDQAAAAYHAIKLCAQGPIQGDLEERNEERFGSGLGLPCPTATTSKIYHESAEGPFRTYLFNPLSFYIEEQLSANRINLSVLRRYKQRCEWFNRQLLFDLASGTADKGAAGRNDKGEWNLKLHLYEFLHDNGIDLYIDPYSDVGKPDLVACQQTDDPIIADAKLHKDGSGKSKFTSGFSQVYSYTVTFGEPFGYLIVFNETERDIHVETECTLSGVPYLELNGKTVFVLTISICPDPVQASKKGKLAPAVTIRKSDLVAGLAS